MPIGALSAGLLYTNLHIESNESIENPDAYFFNPHAAKMLSEAKPKKTMDINCNFQRGGDDQARSSHCGGGGGGYAHVLYGCFMELRSVIRCTLYTLLMTTSKTRLLH